MALLDIATIKSGLDERFLPLEPMLTGMRLVEKPDQECAKRQCEHALGVRFPESFVTLVTQYDFGRLTIGPVVFCRSDEYFVWLTVTNEEGSKQKFPWWCGAHRPRDHVLVAISDPFTIVLNTTTGRVIAFDPAAGSVKSAFAIAESFEKFVRGLGTAMLKRSSTGDNSELASAICAAVGVAEQNRFWKSVVS